MDRALDHQEQEKVRTARADFYNKLKRKHPTSSTPESTESPDDHPISTRSNKTSQMGLSQASKADQSSAAAKSQLIVRFYDPDVRAKDALGRQHDEILAWPDSKLESLHNYIQMLFPLPEGSPFNSEAPVVNLEVMQAFRSRSELRQGLRRSFERMLNFYGFMVSGKSEAQLKQEEDEKRAADLKTASLGTTDPLLESALDAELQKTVDVGHSTPATRSAAEGSKTNTYPDAPIDADTSVTNAETPAKAGESSESASSLPPGTHANISTSSPTPYYIVRAPGYRKKFANWAIRFDHNHLRITRILRCLRVLGIQTEYIAFFDALERTWQDPKISISDRSMGYWRLAVTRPLHLAPDGAKCKWLEGWEKEQENLRRVDEEKLRNERDGVTKKKSVKFGEDVEG